MVVKNVKIFFGKSLIDRFDFNSIRHLFTLFLSYVPKENVLGYMETHTANLAANDLELTLLYMGCLI